MTHINIDRLISSCDDLQRRTIYAAGCMHSSARAFDACMRAFDRADLPAEAVTFRVFLNAPVMEYGEITIHRDGCMETRLAQSDN